MHHEHTASIQLPEGDLRIEVIQRGRRLGVWLVNIVDALFLGGGDEANFQYEVVLRRTDASDAPPLYREGPYDWDVAHEVLDEWRGQLEYFGLSDFLFRKQHNWRMDF